MEAHWYQASTATYLFCIALVASGCCTFIVDYRLTVTSVVDMLSVSLSNYDDHNELATVHQAQHHRIKKNCLQKNMYIDLILTLNCSITHISLLVLMLHCTVYVQNNIFTSLPFRVFLVWLLFTPVYFCLKVNYDRQCNFMKLYADYGWRQHWQLKVNILLCQKELCANCMSRELHVWFQEYNG